MLLIPDRSRQSQVRGWLKLVPHPIQLPRRHAYSKAARSAARTPVRSRRYRSIQQRRLPEFAPNHSSPTGACPRKRRLTSISGQVSRSLEVFFLQTPRPRKENKKLAYRGRYGGTCGRSSRPATAERAHNQRVLQIAGCRRGHTKAEDDHIYPQNDGVAVVSLSKCSEELARCGRTIRVQRSRGYLRSKISKCLIAII